MCVVYLLCIKCIVDVCAYSFVHVLIMCLFRCCLCSLSFLYVLFMCLFMCCLWFVYCVLFVYSIVLYECDTCLDARDSVGSVLCIRCMFGFLFVSLFL